MHRVNARGILRSDNGQVRRCIGNIAPSPMQIRLSKAAYKTMVGLSEVVGDIVIPSPAEHVVDAQMIGLAVRSDTKEPIGAHRVILLVKGTQDSELHPFGGKKRPYNYKTTRSNHYECGVC